MSKQEQDGWTTIHPIITLPEPKPTPPANATLQDLAWHADVDQLYAAITKIIDQVEHELQDGTQHYRPIKQNRLPLANTIRGILQHELRTTP